MIGFAASLGTAVEPTCSTLMASLPSAAVNSASRRWNTSATRGHLALIHRVRPALEVVLDLT